MKHRTTEGGNDRSSAFFEQHKKSGLLIIGILIVAVFIVWKSGLLAARLNSQESDTNTNTAVNEKQKFVRHIDGVSVDSADVENMLPIAIMIENFVSVRPQSGLQKAQVVYEALAEGGITRFMALFASGEHLKQLGPVRSSRTYYVDWAEEYYPLYVHVGGSQQALVKLNESARVYNFDQMSNGQYFWRDTNIAAPHNVFIASDQLNYALRDNQLQEKFGDFTPWNFIKESKKNDRPEEEKYITIPFSNSDYEVKYQYNKEQNVYLRWNGGEEHTDTLTGEQLQVKNVIVQYVATRVIDQVKGLLDMDVRSQGQAVVFHDGKAISGTWKYNTDAQRTQFFNEQNEEILLIPGNIWVEVLPDDRTVEYN
ncbi:MAG TPA: DUF3048 domain-containing protein [Patescibacteria group bacterium]|nr:DUF3048 domain-containing protein [Patescibacteria group bacterium]